MNLEQDEVIEEDHYEPLNDDINDEIKDDIKNTFNPISTLNDIDELNNRLIEVNDQHDKLIQTNYILQKNITIFLHKKQDNTKEKIKEDREIDPDIEKRYLEYVKNINENRKQLKSAQTQYDKLAMDLQSRLDEKELKANEIYNSFTEFKREIAKTAENSRTGKIIPKRIIAQFENAELKKDQEVEKIRLKNINLKTHLRRLENQLRSKEQLAEGLHLIDFEQLKIENQTLNEKIEERDEEIHKLSKKTTTTVQVLTHIREKLQFIQTENQLLKQNLEILEKNITLNRDKMTKKKKEKEIIRKQNHILKKNEGFLHSELLLKDFEKRNDDVTINISKLQELKQQHAYLTKKISSLDSKNNTK